MVSIRDNPYWTSRKNSLELTETLGETVQKFWYKASSKCILLFRSLTFVFQREDCSNISNASLNSTSSSLNSMRTPQSTPIKSLPFSPSQFFNSPISARDVACICTSTPCSSRPTLTSTPVFARECLNTPKIEGTSAFRTPKIRRSLLSSPRTPTPFKEAIATFQNSVMVSLN